MPYRKLSASMLMAGLLFVTCPLLGQQTDSRQTRSIQTASAIRSKPRTPYQQFVRQIHVASPVPKTICYKTETNAFTQIMPPKAFVKGQLNPNARLAPTSQFIVNYTGFTAEARRAFQYAVDIWSNLIVSSVPIRIEANWTAKDPGILGSAGPTDYLRGSDGTQKSNGFYAIALAEKIARRQLNNPNAADITADFNQNNNWYYGTDGKTPAGQTDLVTVVLHEIGHGLGFIGFYRTAGNLGNYAANSPAVYDHFIENGQGERLVRSTTAYPDNSNELYRQLTGNNLYLNGPIMRRRTGQRARIYAPSTFDLGSSLYHLDENFYPRRDTNSLMTPQLANAEAIHSPGPLVLNFFTDMEWKTTSILHDPDALAAEIGEEVKDVVFRARIISDTTLVAGSVRFFYRKAAITATDTAFTSVTPTRVGTTDEYTYTLPAAQAQGTVRYYFQAQDASGRTFTNPGKFDNGAQAYYTILVGPDVVPPTIRFSPPKNFIFTTTVADSLPLYAGISDNRPTGIDTAYVDYQVNGVAQPSLPLRFNPNNITRFGYDSIYVNLIRFPANSLKTGDKISYRIVARDSSRARNQTVSPATGFYELTVIAPQPPRSEYINTFQQASAANDFVGYGFSLATPAGFGDPAIHSEHPYRNGSSYAFESNYEYVLLSPITLKANPDSAVIRYDEVVLVEPNDAGSRFGEEGFYDYAILEGSTDNGQSWRPFLEGYNANAQSDWLTLYNRNQVTGTMGEKNSTSVGTPALFKRREIPLLANGSFKAGDQVLIRFRLFADQLAHGWGWAVDNLRIQVPPPPPVLATEEPGVGRLSVYPNPVSTGQVRVEADLVKPAAEVGVTITNPTGQILRQLILKVNGTKLNQQLDVSPLPTGLYFLQLDVGNATVTRKIVIAR